MIPDTERIEENKFSGGLVVWVCPGVDWDKWQIYGSWEFCKNVESGLIATQR